MNNAPVLVNGKSIDWGNVELVLFGVIVTGITELNYSRKRETKNNYGQGYEPVGYGYGQVTYEADISIYLEEIQNVLQAAPGRSILEIPPFDIIVRFAGEGIVTVKHTLKNCRFTEDNVSSKMNDTNVVVKIPIAYAGLYK